jgi:hypothetical protein
LADPITRLEVTTSNKGQEYLLIFSSSNEVRVWDIESRQHLGSVILGGAKYRSINLAAVCVSNGHSRCLLFVARSDSPYVEVLDVQKQIDKPGSQHVIASLEPKFGPTKSGGITVVSVHPTLPYLGIGTSDGFITVFYCPFLDLESSKVTDVSKSDPRLSRSSIRTTSMQLDSNDGSVSVPSSTVSSGASIVMSAVISPEYAIGGGKLRKISGMGGSVNDPTATDVPVSALAWHHYLPMLGGADGSGRIVIWKVGPLSKGTDDDVGHGTIASRESSVPWTFDSTPRLITSMLFHPTLPRLIVLSYAPGSPSFPPHVSAFCTGHSSLPLLPSPVTPSLNILLDAASRDPVAESMAFAMLPPNLLAQSGGNAYRSICIWVCGKLIVTTDVYSSCGLVTPGGSDYGLSSDNEHEILGLPSTRDDDRMAGLNVSLIAPVTPHHGSGINYGVPVADVFSCPRSWFVVGGEGDEIDLGRNEMDALGTTTDSKAQTSDDLLSGSLADFAAKLAGSTPKKVLSKKSSINDASSINSPPAKSLSPSLNLDGILYVQTSSAILSKPHPRLALAHSLNFRPIAPRSEADQTPLASTRFSWLPSY